MSDPRDTLASRMQALADLRRLEGDYIEADLCDEAAAALAQPAAPGWQLVPVKPTPAMLAAAMATAERHLLSADWHNADCATDQERADKANRDYWAAMLAAAPQAPQPGGQGA